MVQKNKTNKYSIVVELCSNCHEHKWCTHHDAAKYIDTFRQLKEGLKTNWPELEVLKLCGHSGHAGNGDQKDQKDQNGSEPEIEGGIISGGDQVTSRLGAFEISMYLSPAGAYGFSLAGKRPIHLHSKLGSSKYFQI